MDDLEVYSSAALLGALAGMRSMAAPAVLGQLSHSGALDRVRGNMELVHRPGFVITSGLLAAGELIADKLPFTPNRTAMGPLLGRAVSGSISGAVVCSAKRRSAMVGAFVGAVAAIGVAYGAFHLRRQLVKKLKLPDVVVALAEDAVVGMLGTALVSRLK